MRRNLLKQMRNEWRDNIWLVIGLMIVCLAIWFVSIMMAVKVKNTFLPLGADVENVFCMEISYLPEDSPEYIDRGKGKKKRAEDSRDLRMLMTNIRNSPYVEAAAFSINGLPYSYSYYGTIFWKDGEEKDTLGYACNVRTVSPDMVRVLKINSRTGKSREELEKMLRRGEILISNVHEDETSQYLKPRLDPEGLVGRDLIGDGRHYHVGDAVDIIRRSDYEITTGGMAMIPIDESGNFEAYMIAVRVKPGAAGKFREQFENDPSIQSYGNTYLYNLVSPKDQGGTMMMNQDAELRMQAGLIVCLVIIVALGLLGVFWFRIQQRTGEIAIRKVNGATSADIMRRIMGEGIIMLLFATVLASAIGWPLLEALYIGKDGVTVQVVLVTQIVTVALLAIGIMISIAWPARRAMKIKPAIAIKEE